MPFYEYQCAACHAHHEELQRITDRPLRKCPACGKNTLKRLVSAPVFRLKGGGWYETDFKADKDRQRNIAGDKEPVVEKPKEEKPATADAAEKPAETTKETPAAEKSKEATPVGRVKSRKKKTIRRRMHK